MRINGDQGTTGEKVLPLSSDLSESVPADGFGALPKGHPETYGRGADTENPLGPGKVPEFLYMARGRKTMHIDIRSRPKHNAYPIRDIINSYLARGRTTKNCNAAGVGRGKCKAPTRYYTCYPFHHGLNFTEFLYLYIYIYLFILFGISSGTEMATQRWPTILNMLLASKPLHNDASHICTQTADKKRCLQRVLKF